MARTRRMKVSGEEAYYHVVSRTVGGEFYLGDVEKERLLQVIRSYGRLYFVEILGFCLMSNHFHLVVKTRSCVDVTDAEIVERVSFHYGLDPEVVRGKDLAALRQKLCDLSEFVRAVKLDFSRWYNRKNRRRGYFWGDRFKSVLLEGGVALAQCLAYIELNPVRTGIVDRPEAYRWNSLSFRLAGQGDFLSWNGMDMGDVRRYCAMVYQVGKGGRLDSTGREQGRIRGDAREPVSLWRHKVRFFTDGLVLGSKAFVLDAYERFSGCIHKKERRAHRAAGVEGVFSLRRLTAAA
ncbi:REP element-mobilizing transposase RayT [Desulfacinum hydrothermale DSM 13146]|uniref:REP element-mobilizing transposase RayT n=1 Tax=Desulfacinum hydrothermale DSM 13146 TaxID=1121390 RepID=A0A1W1XBF8_9BACT|nr:transposase [Desulfacinum hydrothermale]SMC21008.1 REP element-mobilizing transposase RayT [Desulfacinum hydrothermale DSM 13146]